MHIFFADDSRQPKPTRQKMGPLVATGGFLIDGDRTKELENQLADLCKKTGFPSGESFKWSPGKEFWMSKGLVGKPRREFLLAALDVAIELKVSGVVVISDSTAAKATGAKTAEADVTTLLLERVHNCLRRVNEDGIVIVARPQGGRSDEDKFLANCLEVLQSGTQYVKPNTIAINVLLSPASMVRCLQLADIITSCVTAHVAGEETYSPPIFEKILNLLAKDGSRLGGVGLKIHPDMKYVNLYHWLGKDEIFWKGNGGRPLPIQGFPYSTMAEAW